ncbi:MAG: hypothetical protein QUS14_01245 [Pyrinomonadaceae bacterium]|nr:hypothetical protein [Pyrinomonadaceae bacterium]
MKKDRNTFAAIVFLAASLLFSACGVEPVSTADTYQPQAIQANAAMQEPAPPAPEPSPLMPDLQAEITDQRFVSSATPLGSFDFKNHTYPLPRGWQNPDGSESQLVDGRLDPVSVPISEDMPDEEKVKARTERRIGLSHVATKYFDVTGDGVDEAIVVLKIETTGNAIPQIIYVYEWKDEKPELLWYFRTGDRADGGLKDIRPENGMLLIELYGQDRYMLGEVETGKITGDEEQLCCPTHFTRTVYKWNGRNFIRQGDRLTFTTADPSAVPVKNMGDIVNAAQKRGK